MSIFIFLFLVLKIVFTSTFLIYLTDLKLSKKSKRRIKKLKRVFESVPVTSATKAEVIAVTSYQQS